MQGPRRSWTGVAAVVGGAAAIAATPAFATAYFLAFPGEDRLPFWFTAVEPRLESWLSFASRESVYETFGRVYNLVYLLFLPAVFELHELHRDARSQREMRGFRLLVSGLLATFVGVAGDYWADGIGFPVEVLGLLILAIGATMYGRVLLRSGLLGRWRAWAVLLAGPGALVSLGLVGHIPSGPTLPFAIAWVIVGLALVSRRSPESGTRGTANLG